jgi:TolA-binding protein
MFLEKFPRSDSIPLILYLEGIAEQRSGHYSEASGIFETIRAKYQSSEFAPRALFMKGFSLLQAEQSKDAVAEFEQFGRAYPRHELADDALYWSAIALSLNREFDRCREILDEYLENYKTGQYRSSAVFRKAYCAQQARDYRTSISELYAFLKNYPEAAERDEARILLGDALLNEGRLKEGIAAFEDISAEDSKLYSEAVFKIGKAYKLLEEFEKLRNHMTGFKEKYPRNPRVAEAIYWIGWSYRQQGMLSQAREVYWEAISKYGDDPGIWSLEDLFPALTKLYKGDEERTEFLARLNELYSNAERSARKTLAMRALWARA